MSDSQFITVRPTSASTSKTSNMSADGRRVSQIPERYQLASVLGAGALARLALFAFQPLTSVLERRPELSSPVTSIRSCAYSSSLGDGIIADGYSARRDVSIQPWPRSLRWRCLLSRWCPPSTLADEPQSPLYLLFFSHVVNVESSVMTALLWTLADTIGAVLLVQIWRSRPIRSQPRWKHRDYIVALLFVDNTGWLLTHRYLFNPYTLLSCLARSTTSLDNMLCLYSISAAFAGEH